MNLNVSPASTLSGTVRTPSSKSLTIRALVAGLLADGETKIKFPLDSLDTKACMSACEQLGAKISKEDDVLAVSGTGGNITATSAPIDTLNSGTTIRIMTGVAALAGEQVTLTGDESIQKRPIKPLLDALTQLGVSCTSKNGNPPHTVQGPLAGGECVIPGDVSSQFISSILMSAPYAQEDVVLKISTELKSRPYVDLTLSVLEDFGVDVVNQDYRKFLVLANQKYQACEYVVEGDYSSAAFILAAAAATESKVTVENLLPNSLQADKKILEILKTMGAKVSAGETSVTVESSGQLSGGMFDLSNSPDLVPVTAALAAAADGETIIHNAEHARLKECDRIKAMAVELKKMGAQVEERKDGLKISGGQLKGTNLEGWRDHRIVMALAVAALKADGETQISDADMTAVTFPNFKELMNTLGADVK